MNYNKKLLTKYTRHVLRKLGLLYLFGEPHPYWLEHAVKDYVRKHPGVFQKMLPMSRLGLLSAGEINDMVYDWLTRVSDR